VGWDMVGMGGWEGSFGDKSLSSNCS
jgi:hypothetical protein